MRILCPYLPFSSHPTFLSSVHFHFLFPRPNSLHLRDLSTKAASVAGSTAGFPERLEDDGAAKRRKKRSVAGVDQEELLDPENLADHDSFFFEINGVRIHYKTCHHEVEEVKEGAFRDRRDGAVRIDFPIILLHGFGASVFSWDRVMKPLARMTCSKVLAFDRPAFGLTSRIGYLENKESGGRDDKPLNPYSMAFSVLATLSFIDMLGAGKAVLMGHSAGCLVTLNTYFEFPERIAALIFVAPAIFAPLVVKKDANYGTLVKKKMEEEEVDIDSGASESPFARIWSSFSRLVGVIAGGILKMLKDLTAMIRSLFAKAMAAVLRSFFGLMLVRFVMDKFGILAVRSAWYDSSQVTEDVIQGYTKPLRAKGWDRALVEYTVAFLVASSSKLKPPLSKRLAEITCPVLIVTGDTDRIVPSWNAWGLAQAIPGSTFEVINKCGHLPQEEKAEEFLSVIERFLCKTFGVKEDLDGQFTELVT